MLRYFNIDHLRVLNGFEHFDALETFNEAIYQERVNVQGQE